MPEPLASPPVEIALPEQHGILANVGTPSLAYDAMQKARRLPQLLDKGLRALQAGLDNFLVRHPLEATADFAARTDLLQFEDIYGTACRNTAAKPFSTAPVLSDEAPEEVHSWAEDVDGSSRDLRRFGRDACTDAMQFGLGALYANYDDISETPYLTYLPGHAVIKTQMRKGRGVSRLSRIQLLFEEDATVPGNEWVEKRRRRIMVLRDGDPLSSLDARYASREIYDRSDPNDPNSPWNQNPTEKARPLSPQTMIPIEPLYAGYKSPWVAVPMLGSLAQAERVWCNKASDKDYIIKTSCVPMWDWAGASLTDAALHGVIRPGNVWRSENASAHLRPAEFRGDSILVALKDLDAMLRRMEARGMTLLITEATGQETATGQAIDEARAATVAEALALGWASSFTKAFRFMAIYARLPESLVKQIYVRFRHDFGMRGRNMEYAKLLTQAYVSQEPRIRPELWFSELKRLGVFSDEVIPLDEAAWVEAREEAVLSRLQPLMTGLPLLAA